MTNNYDQKREVANSFDEVADAYLSSEVHRHGTDLKQLTTWCIGATSALDIATGAGHTAGALVEAGVPNVVSADASLSMVSMSENEFDGVKGVAADAERLPFSTDSFDAVTCRIAAHHFPDPKAFVAEVARVIRPGGTFAFEDNVAPEDTDLDSFINNIEKSRDQTHVTSHRTSVWHDWLTEAGFSIEEIAHFKKTLDFQSWVTTQTLDRDQREHVERLLLNAPENATDFFEIQSENDKVESFTNLKAAICAKRIE